MPLTSPPVRCFRARGTGAGALCSGVASWRHAAVIDCGNEGSGGRERRSARRPPLRHRKRFVPRERVGLLASGSSSRGAFPAALSSQWPLSAVVPGHSDGLAPELHRLPHSTSRPAVSRCQELRPWSPLLRGALSRHWSGGDSSRPGGPPSKRRIQRALRTAPIAARSDSRSSGSSHGSSGVRSTAASALASKGAARRQRRDDAIAERTDRGPQRGGEIQLGRVGEQRVAGAAPARAYRARSGVGTAPRPTQHRASPSPRARARLRAPAPRAPHRRGRDRARASPAPPQASTRAGAPRDPRRDRAPCAARRRRASVRAARRRPPRCARATRRGAVRDRARAPARPGRPCARSPARSTRARRAPGRSASRSDR